IGGEPAVRWRSEALASMTSSRMSAKSKSISSPYRHQSLGRDPCHLRDRGDPEPDLVQAVVAQQPHALLDRLVADLVCADPLDRHVADLVAEGHDLVDADAALVAGVRAAGAADGLVRLDVECGLVEVGGLEGLGGQHGALLAVVAEPAR